MDEEGAEDEDSDDTSSMRCQGVEFRQLFTTDDNDLVSETEVCPVTADYDEVDKFVRAFPGLTSSTLFIHVRRYFDIISQEFRRQSMDK